MSTPPDAEQPREQEQAEPEPSEQATAEAPPEARVTENHEDAAEAGAAEGDEAAAEAAVTVGDEAAGEDTEAQEPAPTPARTRRPRTSAAKTTTTRASRKAAPPRSRLVVTDLPKDIFDARVNVPLIHQVVVAQQAAARQGSHSTKTRGQVRGGGRKPYRQKGTGRARQGSIRAPQFTGGGVVGGPVPRSYEQKTPKKMKVAALRGALSDRARHGLVQVVDGFVDGEPKTRDALSVLAMATGAADRTSSVLVVADRSDQLTWKSLRNAPGVHLIDPGQLNTYDVLVSDRVVFTQAALASFMVRSEGGEAGTEGSGGKSARQENEQR